MTPERNDPTSAGFTPPAAGIMRLSCNEVEALCLKAARGAGYDWGLAEEAGFAARWLFARGVDGPGALLSHLNQAAGEAPAMTFDDGVLRAEDEGHLCPIIAGAALSDFAALCRDPIRAEAMDQPLLVLPFLHQIARSSGRPMALAWSGGKVAVSATGHITGDLAALSSVENTAIAVKATSETDAPARTAAEPPPVSSETLWRLDAYAMRTTVPASAASRADAGSDGGDND